MSQITLMAAMTAMIAATGAKSAAPPPPEKLSVAIQVVEASDFPDENAKMIHDIFRDGLSRMTKGQTGPVRQLLQKVYADLERQTQEHMPDLEQAAAEVYARNLTETELKDYAAWLKSPTAQSLKQKLPTVTEEVYSVTASRLKATIAGGVSRAFDAACAGQPCGAGDPLGTADPSKRPM